MKLRLGTRGSKLATAQSELVARQLRELGHEVEIAIVRTTGDRTRASLGKVAGLGVFAAELREALLRGDCDLAVHSYKDLPTAPIPGLIVAAVPEREDSRDALCARDGLTLAELPNGARIGTGSPRRVAQLRARRPDCEFVDIRGNVETRLGRVAAGDVDAVVLAAAGLRRLGLEARITEYLNILPAPGQGALAIECRAGDRATAGALVQLDSMEWRVAAAAERAVLMALGGGCAAPIGALASVDGKTIEISAGVYAADGVRSCRYQHSHPLATADGMRGAAIEGIRAPAIEALLAEAEVAGHSVAEHLLEAGAADVADLGASRPSRLEEFHDDTDLWFRPLDGLRILIPREAGALSREVEKAGATVWSEPLQERRTLQELIAPRAEPAFQALPPEAWELADWVIVTSPRTVATLSELGWPMPPEASIAAVGAATARALEAGGHRVDLIPEGRSSAEDLLAAWPPGPGTVAIPCSELARTRLADELEARGWHATRIPIYTMVPIEPSAELKRAWTAGEFDAVVVTAGSVARRIDDALAWPFGTRVIAFGPPSAAVLRGLGIECAVAPAQDGRGVIAALMGESTCAPQPR